MVTATLPLLLEVGTEELPSSFVDAALAALPKIVADRLAEARLSHGEVRALGTPRRLAVIVRDVAMRQLDLDEEVVGPPEAAAFKDGKPTKAAEAFAAKLGATVESLSIVDKQVGPKQKAGKYVVGRRVEKGRAAMELLGAVLGDVCARVPFKKSMRWADLDATFGRPVQWIVALLGEEVVALSFAGTKSGRTTRGHRFLAPQPLDLQSADSYVEALRAAHVLVDRDERVRTMMERVTAAARAAGGVHDPAAELVDENASLVEEPHVVTGSFDRAFLALPAAVIRAVARGHQKYFCVQQSEDELLPSYLAVVNTANRPDLVTKGTDRVMRARLADARFFFEEDKKVQPEARVEKLAGIVFHNRLGTVREKVARIERLAGQIAARLGLDEGARRSAARAAHLCKFDLVSLMVGEFPELQGHMGRAYARTWNEPEAVASAIRDHYKPVGAHDDVAPSDEAACVALADRFDTLAGCFAVGLAPTGAADPFALRRACIGALRTTIDRGCSRLSFSEIVGVAYDGLEGKKLDLSRIETVAKLEEFAMERLRGIVAGETSGAVADAVLAGSGEAALANVVATVARARVVQSIVRKKEPWLDKAKIVAKRLAGISREAKPVAHGSDAFAASAKKDDAAIAKIAAQLDALTRMLESEEGVRAALVAMETIATELDRIFLETLVNDPNDALTGKRLETLAYGAQCMLRIADFSRLA